MLARAVPELGAWAAPLTRGEVGAILQACGNTRHRTMLTLCYDCGLRLSEVLALRVGDIGGERKLLRIEQGKGATDRLVPLSPTLLQALRACWRLYRPRDGLCAGRAGEALSPTTFQKADTLRDAGKQDLTLSHLTLDLSLLRLQCTRRR
jgi:integrase